MDEENEFVKLRYTIHSYSSYSANHKPENILVKRPTDPLSRWFTDSTTPPHYQFIILKLESPSIVETIKFGKYMKPHVSDLKKFQVYGGMEESNLSLLLTSGLRKDSMSEKFGLRCRTAEGLSFPINFIKIVPLQSWGSAYSYSVWYIELKGKNREDIIQSAINIINLRKEEEAVRILLKHLRRRQYKDAFEALVRESGVKLEGSVQTRLWNAIVEDGNYQLGEQIFEQAAEDGELEWYMSWQPYATEWRALCECSDAVEERLSRDGAPAPPRTRVPPISCADRDPHEPLMCGTEGGYYDSSEDECAVEERPVRPGPRGGHQLVVDPKTGTLYLFGGWNGVKDLDDLWSFDPKTEKWKLLCWNSRLENGPFPRSCHKMVFDPVHRKLYTLGRYLDNGQRTPNNMLSDLFSYDVVKHEWALLCPDTSMVGGPRLVFDHQMCIDAEEQIIYVFGGRILPANSEELQNLQYSGLYAYYIATNSWQLLLADQHDLDAPQPRVSHSMLYHPIQRRLYVFAGQRNKEQLVDLWWWDVRTGRSQPLCRAAPRAPPPQGFTQRATIDPAADEIFVLSGMSKEKVKKVYNSLWVFSLQRQAWTCVYRSDTVTAAEPRPRFAHQLVYDPVRKVHYLFGGNPGNVSSTKVRLDDLWSLRLRRPAVATVRAAVRAVVREACLRELCADPHRAPAALQYLRTELRAATDLNDPAQVSHFHKLATLVVTGESGGEPSAASRALRPHHSRTLARARARVSPQDALARSLAQVLSGDDSSLEPSQPLEETQPARDVADMADEEDEDEDTDDEDIDDAEWHTRAARIRLYEYLCRHFRPSSAPPLVDVTDLVRL